MAMINTKCSSCGGEFMVDGRTKSSNCPYCGVVYYAKKKSTKSKTNHKIIPSKAKKTKKRKVIIALCIGLVLLASAVLILFATTNKEKDTNQISCDNVRSCFEDDFDYSHFDVGIIADSIEQIALGGVNTELKNGGYFITDSRRDIERILDDYDGVNIVGNILSGYDSNMEQAEWFVKSYISNYLSFSVITTISLEFESADDARAYFTSIVDSIESATLFGWNANTFGDGELDCWLGWKSAENDGSNYYATVGLYQQGEYVLAIGAIEMDSSRGKRDVEDICDALGLESPTDVDSN